ncbi:MAG: ribose-5-phosphate isomerase RpiA [Alphaproteobacteria bacterium]|nr:ribose-5-phosphate isomerase RpiA [Alphaproteobacteria bacterium]
MTPDDCKRRAAEEAIELVRDGMTLGLGTGSTAAHFIKLLGERMRAGLRVRGVPTSEDTRRRAAEAGVPLIDADETTVIDLAVDGTDETDSRLNLIKGGGGALLREKIVAAAARRFVVIADASKKVAALGAFPLPVEIDRFAFGLTVRRIRETLAAAGLKAEVSLRKGRDGAAFLSDGGNFILDCRAGLIAEPAALDSALHAIPGVVETGLFIGLADLVILAGPDGVETLTSR